jgi:hypothetical protein
MSSKTSTGIVFIEREFVQTSSCCSIFATKLTRPRTHQDIKPKNILVSRDKGSSDYVTTFKLIDFAFADFQQSDGHSHRPDYDQGGTKWYSK